MAGNVKEWCLNPLGERRYLLGGAWSEGAYLYSIPDAALPFERLPTYGFRCAKYLRPLPASLTGPLQFVSRDRSQDKPVGDDIFRVYRDLHSYDKTDLKSAVESVEESSEYWRKEKVSFTAAYGNERVVLYLFLPKNGTPPYQTVVLFPGANALSERSSSQLAGGPNFEFLIRSGRALVYPIYKGTYERGPSAYYHRLGQPNLWREMNIQWSKDLGRTLDYLETRPEIDRAKIAYYGISLGASMAPRLIAVEDRFRVGVLLMGGFFEPVPPEVDAVNFARRVKVPVLMLNGRNDFLFPLHGSQLPLFRLLGAPEKDKRHVLFDGGHDLTLAFRDQVIKEVLDWLDRYLGPVTLR
jgi:dipeptidyl aminopeptidase/acylaminoacyl peptidase